MEDLAFRHRSIGTELVSCLLETDVVTLSIVDDERSYFPCQYCNSFSISCRPLTVRLDHLCTAWASLDQDSFATGFGRLGILGFLIRYEHKPSSGNRCDGTTTYRELAECEWHVLLVTTDLDEDSAELTESTSDFCFKAAVLDTLGKASMYKSVRFTKIQHGKATELTWRQKRRRWPDNMPGHQHCRRGLGERTAGYRDGQ